MYITILEFPAPLWNRQGGWHLINTSKMGQPPTPEKKKKKTDHGILELRSMGFPTV